MRWRHTRRGASRLAAEAAFGVSAASGGGRCSAWPLHHQCGAAALQSPRRHRRLRASARGEVAALPCGRQHRGGGPPPSVAANNYVIRPPPRGAGGSALQIHIVDRVLAAITT